MRKWYQSLFVKTEAAAKDQMGNARRAVVEAKSETKKMKKEPEATKAGQGAFGRREAEAKAAAPRRWPAPPRSAASSSWRQCQRGSTLFVCTHTSAPFSHVHDHPLPQITH